MMHACMHRSSDNSYTLIHEDTAGNSRHEFLGWKQIISSFTGIISPISAVMLHWIHSSTEKEITEQAGTISCRNSPCQRATDANGSSNAMQMTTREHRLLENHVGPQWKHDTWRHITHTTCVAPCISVQTTTPVLSTEGGEQDHWGPTQAESHRYTMIIII